MTSTEKSNVRPDEGATKKTPAEQRDDLRKKIEAHRGKKIDKQEKDALKKRAKEAAESKEHADKKEELDQLSAEIDQLEEKGADESANDANAEKPSHWTDSIASGFDKVSDMVGKMQNFIAYRFAPILERLKSLKIPFMGDMQSNVDMLIAFLGMHRLMLFSAMRRHNIEPTFNAEKPAEDESAFEHMTGMVEKLKKIHPNYTEKEFYDATMLEFTKKNAAKKACTLTELAEFAKTDVYAEQEKYAKDLQKAAPTVSPETQKKEIKLEAKGNGVELKRENVQIFVEPDGNNGVKINRKVMTDGTIETKSSNWAIKYKNVTIWIKDVKVVDGEMTLTIVNPVKQIDVVTPIDAQTTADLFNVIQADKPVMNFEHRDKDEKTGKTTTYDLAFTRL